MVLLAVVFSLEARAGRASSLSDLLSRSPDRIGQPAVLAAPFETELRRTISRGTDFPATATTPGFIYHLNPELQIYERSSVSLGSAFLDRADTVGAGHFDVGLSYLYANFTQRDGHDIDNIREPVLLVRFPPAQDGLLDRTTVQFQEFTLHTNAFYFSSTYGLTDNWDVNLLVPVFYTTLKVRQSVQTNLTGFRQLPAVRDDAFGVGDVQLRTKVRMLDVDGFKLATGAAVRIPSGNENNFQGIGDTTIAPTLVGSYAVGPVDLHGNVGIEYNGDDLERSRAQWGLGASVGFFDWLTGNIDVIGTDQLSDDHVSKVVDASPDQVGEGFFGSNIRLVRHGQKTEVITTIDRLDSIDVAVGAKVNLFKSLVGFVSVIVPISTGGVRPDVIQAAGLEVSF